MMDVAQRALLLVLFFVAATSAYGEQFKYLCDVKGNVDFTSFDFVYERPAKWPGNWHIQQPVMITEATLKIAGFGKIKSTLTVMAEGSPYHLNNLSMLAMTPTYSIFMLSLLEDAKSKSAWGFGKYRIWRPGTYDDRNFFILCEQ